MRKKWFHNAFFLEPVLWIRIRFRIQHPAFQVNPDPGSGSRSRVLMTKNWKNKAEKNEKIKHLTFFYFCGSFLRSWIRIQSGSVELVVSAFPPALTTVGSPDWSILAVISWANLARTVPCHIWMAEILQHILPAAQPYLSHAESCLSPHSLLSVPAIPTIFFLYLTVCCIVLIYLAVSCCSWLYLVNLAVSCWILVFLIGSCYGLCPCVLLYLAVPGFILL
jgi:hypothetical protein